MLQEVTIQVLSLLLSLDVKIREWFKKNTSILPHAKEILFKAEHFAMSFTLQSSSTA